MNRGFLSNDHPALTKFEPVKETKVSACVDKLGTRSAGQRTIVNHDSACVGL